MPHGIQTRVLRRAHACGQGIAPEAVGDTAAEAPTASTGMGRGSMGAGLAVPAATAYLVIIEQAADRMRLGRALARQPRDRRSGWAVVAAGRALRCASASVPDEIRCVARLREPSLRSLGPHPKSNHASSVSPRAAAWSQSGCMLESGWLASCLTPVQLG